MVANLTFIFAKETLATIAGHYATFFSCLLDELHESTETLIAELKFGILSGTTNRENSKETPRLQSERNKIFLELRKRLVIAIVHASHYVKLDRRLICENTDCL